jgi:peptidoglycan/LPS O-acetylase OafA/YrhL
MQAIDPIRIRNRGLLVQCSGPVPRAYCAFLIHFAFILLANTVLLALHVKALQLELSLIVLVSVLSWIAANYLYRWVELPIGRWRPAALFS